MRSNRYVDNVDLREKNETRNPMQKCILNIYFVFVFHFYKEVGAKRDFLYFIPRSTLRILFSFQSFVWNDDNQYEVRLYFQFINWKQTAVK